MSAAPTIGSLFSGYGGLDTAVEQVLGARTVWQLDLVGADVRRRHWPDARQVAADVATVDPLDLRRPDVLVGGFPCQDVSQAGRGAGLTGARTGLYRQLVRFTEAYRPDLVVMENVFGLVRYMPLLEQDWSSIGYGLTWTTCHAADVGAPHLRRRVFLVATPGAGRGEVHTPTSKPPGRQVWPWPTPTARDHKTGELPSRVGGEALSAAAGAPALAQWGRRLCPAWVEVLMGLPPGWTAPDGPRLEIDAVPRWPRGRYPADWDRSRPWPGFNWEPPRTLPDGPPVRGRAARIKMLGNGVVPQQAARALMHLLQTPRQL